MNENESHQAKSIIRIQPPYVWAFLGICAGVIAVAFLYYYGVNESMGSDNETRGTFGDMFGGLNTIFSGFAFAGVLITIIMQMKELQMTRQIMNDSVIEQRESQKALKEQVDEMNRSRILNSLSTYLENSNNNNQYNAISRNLLQEQIEELINGRFKNNVKPSFSVTNSSSQFTVKNLLVNVTILSYEITYRDMKTLFLNSNSNLYCKNSETINYIHRDEQCSGLIIYCMDHINFKLWKHTYAYFNHVDKSEEIINVEIDKDSIDEEIEQCKRESLNWKDKS